MPDAFLAAMLIAQLVLLKRVFGLLLLSLITRAVFRIVRSYGTRSATPMTNILESTSVQALVLTIICLLFTSCGVMRERNAAITLTGRVVDEAGMPLDQVQLYVTKSRVSLTAESFLTLDESDLDLEDGRFRVTCRACSNVQMHFSRAGYYSETVDFHVDYATREAGRLSSEVAQDLERTDLQIVLRSAQNAVRLVSFEGFLRATANGPATVVPMRRDMGSQGVKQDRLSRPPGKNTKYLPGYVQLLAAVTKDDTLASESPPGNPRIKFPQPPVVDFSEADGGIILYEFTSGDRQKVYREMRMAPADGYQSSLLLDSVDRDGTYYFFCRIGDRFGKGHVNVPSFSHLDGKEGEVVMAYMEIRLNLEGSRNVETAR